ncbi:MAG: ABC transporter permease [Elusimicrobiota bacterium]|jgi:ABC-type antimicrobial peptide transport system permease subunit|nr:ABC transporter permease [Elusimicrobiota bacterium]
MLTRMLIAAGIGLREILNNKMRSFLSAFAISIGVFTFLFVFSAINNAKERISKATELGGEYSFNLRIDWERARKIALNTASFAEIARKVPEAQIIFPVSSNINTDIMLAGDNTLYEASFTGITPDWRKVNWVYGKVEGRFINWDDITARRKVAVFIYEPLSNKEKNYDHRRRGRYGGNEETKELKWEAYNKAMLGRKVRIRGLKEDFTIVGVVRAPLFADDERLQKNMNDFLLPYTALEDTFYGDRYIEEIFAAFKNDKDLQTGRHKLVNALRMREGKMKADYDIKTFHDRAENMFRSMRETLLMVSVLGLIAMISGGIGIMNVVLATIYARTKEIGTRRAIGATRLDIFMQFSFESIVLSLLGACAGWVIALFAMSYIADLLSIDARLGAIAVLCAFAAAAGTGFCFSLYPSLKAANMNPVDALKFE